MFGERRHEPSEGDARIAQYVEALQRLALGNYDLPFPTAPLADDLDRIGDALCHLAAQMAHREHQVRTLQSITTSINAGLLLDDVLEQVYDHFHAIIPYSRIGLALIEPDGTARIRWAKSDGPLVIADSYHAPLAGSSLSTLISTGSPRILNDLEAYLRQKPDSHSTRLLLEEGILSSLTCPLMVDGKPVGLLFFSSRQKNTYSDAHVDLFLSIAAQLAVTVEKARLTSDLAAQKATIEAQNQKLQQLNDLKNAFLGMAAHDLREPLANVLSACEVLLTAEAALNDEDRSAIITGISYQTSYLLEMLSDLLDIAQIETGKLALKLTPLPLHHHLAQAVTYHHRMAERKQTRVTLEPFEDGHALADPPRLRQVLDNLLSNAIKYSPMGSLVRVRAHHLAGRGWRIEVQDEGPGIPVHDRHRLFQDFARLSTPPTGGEKSVGLGLAIARRVVEAHGGDIGVDSLPGTGAVFWFTLPAG